MNRKIPDRLPSGPLFSCDEEPCSEEVSYPPDLLWWWPQLKGWYCDNHPEVLEDYGPFDTELEQGISLADWLKDTQAS